MDKHKQRQAGAQSFTGRRAKVRGKGRRRPGKVPDGQQAGMHVSGQALPGD